MYRLATIAVGLPVTAGLLMGILIGTGHASEPVAVSGPRVSELSRAPSWEIPTVDAIRTQSLEWVLRTTPSNGPNHARVTQIWERPDRATDVIATALDAVAVVDPRVAAFRDAGGEGQLPVFTGSEETAAFPRNVVALWRGRELVRQARFDEALPLLVDADVATSIDPASLLFYRGCCQHWLLDREAALESFDRLLEREDDIPVRFAHLARLLRADIASVESDSLDHIARRIRDVRRRLDLGHAGPQTRKVQDGIIESLDKLIDKAEQQQQQQAGGGGGGGGGGSGQDGQLQPMDDSRIAGGRGPGEVRKKDLGDGDGWGNLPPHEREAALQQIGREYPPHYREAIEQYFKRLATGEDRAP
jgi:tetratricopeptide (TPR) repeat protein